MVLQTMPVYQTNKVDEDFLLDSESGKFLFKKLNKVFGLPFFDLNTEELITLTQDKIELMRTQKPNRTKIQAVIPVDPYRIGWLLWHKKYLKTLQSSFLTLPTGKGVKWMMSKLKKPIPSNMSLISYLMNLIRLAELKGYSICILGGNAKSCEKLFFNLKHAFPKLNIMGRYHKTKDTSAMKMIWQSIIKMSPDIILLSVGYKEGLDWLQQNRNEVKNSLIINIANQIEYLAGSRKKPPSYFLEKNLGWLWNITSNPIKWYKLGYVLWWFLRVYIERVLLIFR